MCIRDRLCAQIVHDQQIALQIPPHVGSRLLLLLFTEAAELVGFKLGKHVGRRVIDHGEAALGYLPGDRCV